MSKEILCKQIFEEIFPNSNITNGGSHVKTKLCWLESQYIAIKKTFSQTGVTGSAQKVLHRKNLKKQASGDNHKH